MKILPLLLVGLLMLSTGSFAASTYCIRMNSTSPICFNNTITTGTKINWSDVLNTPAMYTQWRFQVAGQGAIVVTNNTLVRLLSGSGISITNDTEGNITITSTVTDTDTNNGGTSNLSVFNSPDGSIVFAKNTTLVNGTVNQSWLANALQNATICHTDGTNCPGTGNVTANGAANYLPKFTNATHLVTSNVYDNGSMVNITANLTVGVVGANTTNISNTQTGDFLIQAPRFVCMNCTTPTHALTVQGSVNITGETIIGGIKGDGSGKALCVKADGFIGTCSDAVGAGGTCTCA